MIIEYLRQVVFYISGIDLKLRFFQSIFKMYARKIFKDLETNDLVDCKFVPKN